MLYLTPELFIDALILLLYFPSATAKELCLKLIDVYETETDNNSINEDDILVFYVDLVKLILERDIDITKRNELDVLLLKFKFHPVISKDPEIYTIIKGVMTGQPEEDDTRAPYIIRKISNALLWYDNTKSVRKLFAKLMGSKNKSNASPEEQEKALLEIKEMCGEIVERTDKGLRKDDTDDQRIFKVDFCNRDELMKAFQIYKSVSVDYRFKCGLQGFNRAYVGGCPQGSSIVHNALSFNAKTYVLLDYVRWGFMYNEIPVSVTNPTILLYSLENETHANVRQLFFRIYVNLYKKLPPDNITEKEIVDFCMEQVNKSGWKLIIDRKIGTDFGVLEFQTSFQEYEKLGYTPRLCVVDYVNNMKKGDNDSNWLLIKELYNTCCNFTKSRHCTFVTAHQLNRQAAELARMFPIGAVKKFNMSHLAEGTDPQREVDIAMFQAKEMDAIGRTFLSFNLDKDRYDPELTEKRRYFSYMFQGPLGILDDINGPDMSVTNINAVPVEGEEDILLPNPDEISKEEGVELTLELTSEQSKEPVIEKSKEQPQPPHIALTLQDTLKQASQEKPVVMMGI